MLAALPATVDCSCVANVEPPETDGAVAPVAPELVSP